MCGQVKYQLDIPWWNGYPRDSGLAPLPVPYRGYRIASDNVATPSQGNLCVKRGHNGGSAQVHPRERRWPVAATREDGAARRDGALLLISSISARTGDLPRSSSDPDFMYCYIPATWLVAALITLTSRISAVRQPRTPQGPRAVHVCLRLVGHAGQGQA